MKFQPIQPNRGQFFWTEADALVSFAQSHNMAVRGHTLVWHQQNPAWLTNGNFQPSELASILQDHIRTVVGRYAGKLYAWDVVNEAFNDNGTMRSTIWSDSPGIGHAGTAYIEQAFRWAHDADPNALLFYNDYNGEGINSKSDAIYAMAKDFQSRGVPISGIGLQMHFTTSTPSVASMDANIKRITDLGLQVHLTELDVRLPVDSSGNATAANLTAQAQIYKSVVSLCLRYPLCTAVQTWGFTDKYSWVPGTFPGFGAGLPLDATYHNKPAYDSVQNALATAPPVISAAGLANAASYAVGSVAPGEIIVLFGATFGPAALVQGQIDSTGRLATNAGGARLVFDGTPAPIIYSRTGQISAVAPFGIAGHTTTQLQYEYGGIASNTATLDVVPVRPALFTLDSSGSGPGAILDASYRVNSQSNPAQPGDVILAFGTGGGTTSPASLDGQILTAPPFPAVTATAQIGGVDCPMQYAGGASNLVAGALQFNIQIAPGVASGPQPIVVTIRGVPSQSGVTVWIR